MRNSTTNHRFIRREQTQLLMENSSISKVESLVRRLKLDVVHKHIKPKKALDLLLKKVKEEFK